jgi:peptide/nickel transport system substrate-binding protein
MGDGRGARRSPDGSAVLVAACAACAALSCGRPPASVPTPDTTLRVGVAQLAAVSNPIGGLRQLAQNLSFDVLARAGEDGRMEPSLAESWTASDDGRTLIIKLRKGVKFTDGLPLDAAVAAANLPKSLKELMGPLYDDVASVEPSGTDSLRIEFRRASLLDREGLEATVSRPGSLVGIGTGPYGTVANSTTELQSNPDYYLGRPTINRIVVANYPSVRAAWAEALRGNLDMLYEVSPDAVDSLERSKTISTFVYTRHYQLVLVLNSKAPALSSLDTRRALYAAIDRTAVVREGLRGHGVVSSGALWPQHWALPADRKSTAFAPVEDLIARATGHGTRKIRFTCLVPANDDQERMALEVKRQLASAGIEMAVESVSQQQLFARAGAGDYEAALTELVSGPTLLRPYIVWQSKSPYNWGRFGNATVDAALERARDAKSNEEYKAAVIGVQQAFVDDPPAIFLAWSVRARAVSSRFVVPPLESGRDVLATLRLWKPAPAELRASRN